MKYPELTNVESIKAPLECCPYPELDRQIGIRVGDPFEHRGRNNEVHVDLNYEVVTVNTITYGNCYPLAEVPAKFVEMHQKVIAELDIVIKELKKHRKRITASLMQYQANQAGPFHVEVVWNREFDFVPYGQTYTTEDAAIVAAVELENSGDGERVKNARVLDSQGNVVWVYGKKVRPGK